MESEELIQLIGKGETREIEFKSWIKAKSKKDLMGVITKEAVALANTFGVTNKTVQDLCCYDERKVRYILSKMKEDGIISLIAAGRNSYYIRTNNKPTINQQ